MAVLVVVPAGSAEEADVAGAATARYGSPAEVIAALESAAGPVVLAAAGLSAADELAVAAVITARGLPVIEVRAERWDGHTHSPLSAACRGVISGFGVAPGIVAAAGVLARESR